MNLVARWVWLGLLLAGGALASAQPVLRFSSPETRRELRAVVELQLEALREGDWATAYGQSATAFRARVVPADFVRLFRRHYPILLANTRAEFGLLQDDGRQARVPVRVYAGEVSTALIFTLVREPRGWRVLRITEDRTGAAL